ncbi:hypothetical protein GDO86_012796 [Hymenochirus boettgeri]|uniref:E3 ubiquitin-protein ligase RNF26 n=1 Tax=Hymenochirus boettgeri TaxID=247094 RepID=A0A8T2IRF6_9PIPI|nr:hypothetical protein GDO86_012796 [Hymenochirus boettgeri]
MQGFLMLLNGIGWTVEMLLLLLDMNYWLVSCMVSLLFWTIRFVFNLPGTLANGLVQSWEGLLGLLVRAGDSSFSLLLTTVQSVGDVVRGGLASLDSLKLVWNLLCHLIFRSRELLHRGLLNITLSAQSLHRNFWEALSITGSLAAYLVNSFVNICLIATQNVLSAALALWLSTVHVIFTGLEIVPILLSQLSSSAVAVAFLLWTPCQLLLDLLTSLSRGVGLLFFKNTYEIMLLLLLIFACRMIFRPTPAVRQFQLRTVQLYRMALVLACSVLNSEVLRRIIARSLNLFRMYSGTWLRDWNMRRMRIENPSVGPAIVRNPTAIRMPIPPVRPVVSQNTLPNSLANPQPMPQSSRNISVPTERGEGSQDPWKLLKQQEESKKCVICQDENKTVLLLPCRHLCLCASCNQILQRQPIYQRNCPLCRKMILQTLNVYI